MLHHIGKWCSEAHNWRSPSCDNNFNFHALAQTNEKKALQLLWKHHEMPSFSICVNILDFCRRTSTGYRFLLNQIIEGHEKNKRLSFGKDATIFYTSTCTTSIPDSIIFLLLYLPFTWYTVCVYMLVNENKITVAKRKKKRDSTRKTRNSKQKKILLENWKFLRKKSRNCRSRKKKAKKGRWNRFFDSPFIHLEIFFFYRNFASS